MWILGRDDRTLEDSKSALLRKLPHAHIRTFALDLGLNSEILRFADQWEGPLHVLVNNAATAPQIRTETAEGTETQWAVNVLSYYRMSIAMAPFMMHGQDARIVNVASYWAGNLNLNDPEFKHNHYDNDEAYRQSKQANRMIAAGLSEKPPFSGNITINACHPGDVRSKLSGDLGFAGHQSPSRGAKTPVFLATNPSVKGITGKYFSDCQQKHCEFSSDKKMIADLLNYLSQ